VIFSLVRVDNRLIHGQILEAWVPYMQASCLVVADDDVASDFFRETVIRMAVPRDIDVVISSVDDFARSHSFDEHSGRKTILLFSSVGAARKARDLGFRFDRLNVGNVYTEQGGVRCGRSIHFTENDIEDILQMIYEGVRVELRCVPKDKPLDFFDALKKTNHELPASVKKDKTVVA
jgi:PTS system mannose-specific IIB component